MKQKKRLTCEIQTEKLGLNTQNVSVALYYVHGYSRKTTPIQVRC